MAKREICRKIRSISSAGRRTFVYFLTTSEMAVEGALVELYGVGVHILESGDEMYVSGMTSVRERALRLIDLLASNFVSPTALGDVVADWIE